MKLNRTVSIRAAAGGSLRTAVFRGAEHVVVPVVALVEGVLHAVNSEYPELVLAEEFGRAIAGWNGEPAMFDHPDVNGVKVSANSPEILEQFQLGQVFHATVSNKRLLMEAYIDPVRAEAVGAGAQELLATLQAGGMVEVSVGVLVDVEETPGEYEGVRYAGIWRNLTPDHLALLPTGVIGACSNEAGCGAGIARAAAAPRRSHILTAQGIEVAPMASVINSTPKAGDAPAETRTLRERLMASVRSVFAAAKGPEDMSDGDLRRAVEAKLRDTVPAFYYLGPLYPQDNLAIFETYTSDGQWHLYQHSYSVADDGTVTLEGSPVEVELVSTYTVKSAEQNIAPTEVVAACGCKNNHEPQPNPNEGASIMHRNAARISALIVNSKTPWSEHDRTHLEAQTDERLAVLEQQAADAAKEPEPPPAPEIKLTDLPQAWQDAINGQAVAAAAAKTAKVTALASAQSVFTAAQLEQKTVEELTQLEALIGLQAAPPAVSFAAAAGAAPVVRDNAMAAPPKIGFSETNEAIRAAAKR